MTSQEPYDDAMFDFSRGDFDGAIAGLRAVLAAEPAHFEAQLTLGMAYYRRGDFAPAIAEGHKAEHHGLQAKIESWRADAKTSPSGAKLSDEPELQMARPKPPPTVIFPNQPWKKKKADTDTPAPGIPKPDSKI